MRQSTAQVNEFLYLSKKIRVGILACPVQPANLIVLCIGIVVALL